MSAPDPLAAIALTEPRGIPQEGDSGRCRTCLRPIWFEHTERGKGYLPRVGWSDRARTDALVCFKAIRYTHAPLKGRELAVWNAALAEAREAVGEIVAERDAAREALGRVEALLTEGPDSWEGYDTHDIGHAFHADSVTDWTSELRAALTQPATNEEAGTDD